MVESDVDAGGTAFQVLFVPVGSLLTLSKAPG